MGKPIVVLFARNVETKEVKRFGIKGFKPYFYVADETGDMLSCYGDRIRKVEVGLPTDVKKQRMRYEKTFDADVLYDMRYVIDKGIYYGFDEELNPVDVPVMEPRICYFDIEVASPPEIFPNVKEAKYPVVLVSWYDGYTEECGVISLGGRQVRENQVVVGSEREVLETFARIVKERDFDIVTGWNSETFDVPYIMKRARKCNADVKGLSRMESRPPDERRWLGRTRIDMLDLFKDWSKPIGKQVSYRLKAIVKQPQFGGFTYPEQGAHIQQLMEEDRWEELVEYSFNDVKALRILDKKIGLFMFYEQLRKLVGVKFSDLFGRAKIVEYFLMHEGIKPMPTRVHKDKVEDYKGALVVSPQPGIHENVGVTDLKCVDDQTEVLTPSGWVNISQLKVGVPIAVRDDVTKQIIFDDTYEYYEKEYHGIMYEVDKKFLNFKITPNHRVLFARRKNNARSGESYWRDESIYMPIEDLVKKYTKLPLTIPVFGEWVGLKQDTIVVGKYVHDMNKWLKFVGLWLSDGYILSSHSLQITQSTYVDECRHVLDDLGIKYTETITKAEDHPTAKLDIHNFYIHDIVYTEQMIKWFGDHRARCKYIPRWILQLDKTHLQALYEGLMLGDGCGFNGIHSFTTTSKQLADDVQEVCLKIGLPATVHKYEYDYTDVFYQVGITTRDNRALVLRGNYPERVQYDGNVYCVTTKTGNFVIRRHGKVCVTGNSLYPSIILAKNLSPDIDKMIPKVIVKLMAVRDEMRKAKLDGKADAALKTSEQSLKYIINSFYGYMGFSGAKMYAPEIAGEITETGREISKALHALLHEMGYTLVYGDTDSTFFKSIKNVDEAKEIERKINEYLVKWALQQGIEEKYAPVVKLEKIYRRIVFKRKGDSDEAAKKRYAGHLIWKDGFEKNELDYAGIELKRSDTAPITKTILEEFFKEVLIHDDLEAAQQVVVKYEKLVRNGQVKIMDVAIPKGMNDEATVESAHVKGARIGEEVFKIHFDQVNKPRLLYTKRPWPQVCIDESVSEESVKSVCEIDWEKMCDRVVVKKTKSLLESLGFNWDVVVHGQKSIFDY